MFYTPAASHLDMLKILLTFPPFIFLHLLEVIMQNTFFSCSFSKFLSYIFTSSLSKTCHVQNVPLLDV